MVASLFYNWLTEHTIDLTNESASDLYALGVVVYEWLSGNRPFHGKSFEEICGQHLFLQKGTHLGIPPTNKQVTVTGIVIERIVDGKTVEGWVEMDLLGMLQQLGGLPAPGQAG